jgi:hypothetical protein
LPVEEEQELAVTAHGFLASPLTDNIHEMEDGSLLIENCPIARTGFQTYAVRDLPQQAARDMGIDLSDPSAEIDLYRPPEEVFAPEFIASLEGRPITDNHPPDFVTPETYSQYALGHIQNVRRGDEALPSGDWPLLADLVISGEPLVGKVRRKEAREISLGYDYSIKRAGDRVDQVGMVGNHNAVVPKGRAGDDVRIMDAAPLETADGAGSAVVTLSSVSPEGEVVKPPPVPSASPPEPAAPLPPEPSAGHVALNANVVQPKKNKEKPKVKNNLLHIFGLGLRAKAADAETSPEELAEMAKDVGRVADVDPEKVGESTPSRDGKAKDAPAIDPVDKDHGPAADRRKAAHDALDKMLDATGAKDGRAKDSDIAELRDLFNEYLGEEEAEPEHQADADPAELEELLGAGEEPDAEDAVEVDPGEEALPSGEERLETEDEEMGEGECAHCGTAHDLANCPKCGCTDRKAPAMDRAKAADGVAATLRMLRGAVARDGGPKTRAAFNTALATVTKASRVRPAGRGGYGEFAGAARARDGKRTGPPPAHMRAHAADSAVVQEEKLQAYYDARRTGAAPAQGGK